LRQLARFCYRRRRVVVVAWLALIVSLFVLSGAFGGEFRTEFKLPGSESQAALDILEERGLSERTGFVAQVVFKAEQGINDPAVRGAMESFFAGIEREVNGVRVSSPYAQENAYQVAGNVAYAEVNFSDRKQEQYLKDARVIKGLLGEIDVPGLQVELGGDVFAQEPHFSSEVIGLFAAIIILLVAFGSVIAMGLPVITALFGIGCGVAIIGLITLVLPIPDFTMQVAMMIGIGVGIDYALLIVTRYRQALHDGLDPERAISLAVDTSGRAVVFAGLTVVISLLGMFMMNLDFIRGVAISAALAVVMTMSASVTLLPALLGFVGRGIDRFGLPHRLSGAEGDIGNTFWYRWSRIIQAHPWPALIASTALLLVLAAPVFSLRLGFSDAGNRGTGDTTRRAYDLLSEGFGPGFNGPILLVVDSARGAPDAQVLQRLVQAINATEGVAPPAQPIPLPDAGVVLINVFPATAPQDLETTELVHRLRNEAIPPVVAGTDVAVRATGLPPIVVDFSDYTADRLPIFFGAVLLLSFLLLLTVFHSVVVPIKAVVMNLLSIGAAFGALVAVFQWGVLGSLFGVSKEGPIEAWAPMMLFAIVFGLSMDYEVFLLTRVREEYDRCGDNGRAVADGLAATGRVISAAAAIMVCVFGSFILSDERALKLMGFGLAFAIFIDATLVRLVLVPSAMELLGKANWWAPDWLVRYLPRIRVEAAEPAPVQEPVPVLATIE
jgi:putative drug exporter of the RND superfamily